MMYLYVVWNVMNRMMASRPETRNIFSKFSSIQFHMPRGATGSSTSSSGITPQLIFCSMSSPYVPPECAGQQPGGAQA
jgi:hypothetical protein